MKIYSPEIIGDTSLTGALDVTGGITGSLFGTASLAQQVQSNNNDSGLDFKLTFVTDQGKVDLYNAQKSNLLVNPNTGKLTVTSVSASSGFTGSLFGTASFATTASFALNATPPFPFTGSAGISGSIILNGNETISGSLLIGASAFRNQINIQNANGTANTLSTDGNSNDIIVIGAGNTVGKGQDIAIGSNNNSGGHANGQGNMIVGRSNTMSNGNQKNYNFIVGVSNTLNNDGNYRMIMGHDHQSAAVASYGGIFAGTNNTLSHNRSVIIGGQDIITQADDTVYVPNLHVSGSQIISGSLRGDVSALSIASNTASLDCSTGNFYTLSLVSGSDTYINPSNIQPGQTINLRITQPDAGFGTVSFPSSVKQVTGSAYVPTAAAFAQDIVTFISFDSTSLYLSNIKNFV
jgi:hypothetical protein